jgi:hypothetical protein
MAWVRIPAFTGGNSSKAKVQRGDATCGKKRRYPFSHRVRERYKLVHQKRARDRSAAARKHGTRKAEMNKLSGIMVSAAITGTVAFQPLRSPRSQMLRVRARRSLQIPRAIGYVVTMLPRTNQSHIRPWDSPHIRLPQFFGLYPFRHGWHLVPNDQT